MPELIPRRRTIGYGGGTGVEGREIPGDLLCQYRRVYTDRRGVLAQEMCLAYSRRVQQHVSAVPRKAACVIFDVLP